MQNQIIVSLALITISTGVDAFDLFQHRISKDQFIKADPRLSRYLNDNVVFWSQPDFSYKHRVHIYSNSNDEIG